MTGPLLRTGSLKAFHPLGAVGHPVYLAASQLRAAISRRLGVEVANTFAIPQRNEDGDTIDWYAAQSGPVVPWSAATTDERVQAQERLVEVRAQLEELARVMQQESDAERQVFGRLLEHVTQFPDDEHVYLVNDTPVVSFWGFQLNNAAVGSDPLLNLDLLDAQPTGPVAEGRPAWRFPWWLWLLLLLLLIPLLFFLLRGCQEPPPEEHAVADGPVPVAESLPPAGEEPVVLSEETPVAESLDAPLTAEEVQSEVLVDDRRAGRVEINRGPVAIEGGDSVTALQDGEVQVLPESAVAEEVLIDDAGGEEEALVAAETGVEAVPVDPVEPMVAEEAITDEAAETALVDPGEEGEAETGVEAGIETDAEPEEVGPVAEPAVEPETEAAEDPSAETESPVVNETGEEQGGQPSAEEPLQDAKGASDPAAPAEDPNAAAGPGPGPGPEAEPTTRTGEPLTIPRTVSGPGAVRLLNGGWRTATSLQDPKTGLPIKLEYQLQDGAGKVRLKRHDGSACEGDVKAGLNAGNLVIDSTGNIVCADGTNFGRPKLECKPGADGKADCKGSYPGGESFSVDINKKNR